MDNDGGYGLKVLSEYQNLKEVAVGKNISIFTTALIKPPLQVVRPVVVTPVKPTAVGDMAAAAPKKPGVNAGEEIAAL